ncbi:cobyrinate a,c-diamide synthase [Nocardia sp. NPDC057353]|uniref:cobyrinate a,c-diamide synthase n=1 Tax=Nocardia sp. NPDC057353 TaxID=3346104 RepID=UPI003625DF01
MSGVPAVVVAAPASGSGKTTLATGLIGALRRAGHRVAPFKVGPDYIDPGYHGLAAGRPGRNLDPVLVGVERVPGLYRHGSRGCDLAVVEGVMGLFDGRIDEHAGPIAEGSTAQVAGVLGAPVVLVVDARGHSQSLAALLHGFATYDSGVRLGGVILNRVGSERHEQVLRAACDRVGLPVLGALPRLAELELPSRHLGLIPAVEHGAPARAAVAAMTELVAAHVDLAAVAAMAGAAVPGEAWDPATALADYGVPAGKRPVVAVAGGPAFTFGYAEHRELLAAAGARVEVFDPLHDPLPAGTAGLVVPGGFPEEHAERLAANTPLLGEVAALAAAGLPVHAECAGLLYLARSLDGHRMAGVIDADAEFGPRLTLGYRDAVALTGSPLWAAGQRVRGHEFHRTRLVRAGESARAWGWRGSDGSPVTEGAVTAAVHASYLHTHPAGDPAAIARFTAAAAAFAATRIGA